VPFNKAQLNPDDMAMKGLEDGAGVELESDSGTVKAIVRADETLRIRAWSRWCTASAIWPGRGDYANVGVSDQSFDQHRRICRTITPCRACRGSR